MRKLKQTESSIMNDIKQALTLRKWTCFRMPPSIYSQKGIADLCCLRWGITAWIEVKSLKGQLSPAQRRFGEMVSDAGGIYIVARSVEYAVKMTDQIIINYGYKIGGDHLTPDKNCCLEIAEI